MLEMILAIESKEVLLWDVLLIFNSSILTMSFLSNFKYNDEI